MESQPMKMAASEEAYGKTAVTLLLGPLLRRSIQKMKKAQMKSKFLMP
nr:hypothetical protein P5665_06575 [Bacillus subtilis]